MEATWKCDGVELYLGDCRDVLATLPEESIDMIWTDPPYGHGNADGDLLSRRAEAVGDGLATRQEAIANDQPEEMREVVDGMLNHAARLLKRDCCCCCCCCCGGGPKPTFAWVAERMDRLGMAFFHSIIWDKRNPGMGWRYRRQHEMVMVAHRTGGKLLWANNDVKVPNIVSYYPPRDRIHPNEKPLAMVLDFVRWHSTEGQMVCDPFAGSGTTVEACIRLGRNVIAVEQDEKHFATMVKRTERAIADGALFTAAPSIQGTMFEDAP